MAREDLDIVIRQRGARTVARAIEDISRVADRSTKSLFLLVRAFRAIRDAAILLGGFGALSGFIQQLDQLTAYENRIRLVTSSMAELNAVNKELFESARESRTEYSAIVELYARTALSARELGRSQQELIDFTTTVSKAATISGASVREANAALIQLSQGIASDRLGGDELRSILEQLPFVADIITNYLNQIGTFGKVTRGSLRELGSEGKLTGRIVLDAFKEAKVGVDELFAQTNATVGQSLIVLQSDLQEAFLQFDDFLGLTQTLTGAVFLLSNNFDVLAGSVAGVTAAFTVFFAIRYVATIGTMITLVSLLAGSFFALGRAILFSPFALLAAVFVGLSVAARTFGNEIAIAEGAINTYGDVAVATWQLALEKATEYGEWFASTWPDNVATFNRVFDNIGLRIPLTFEELLDTIRSWANFVVGIFVGLQRSLPAILERLPFAIGEVFVNVSRNVLLIVQSLLNSLIRLIQRGINFLLDPIVRVGDLLSQGGEFASALGLDKFAEQTKALADALKSVGDVDLGQLDFDVPVNRYERYSTEIADIIKETFTDELLGTDFVGQAISTVLERSDRIAIQREIDKLLAETDLGKEPTGSGSGSGTSTDETKKSGGRTRKTFEDFLREIQGQNEALKVNSDIREKLLKIVSVEKSLRRELTTAERALYLDLLETNQSLERQSEIFDSLRQPQRDYINLIQDLIALFREGKISADEFNQKLIEGKIEALENSREFSDGIERGFLKALQAQTDYAAKGEELFNDLSRAIEDSVVSFVETGKLSVSDFFKDFLSQIIRFMTNSLVLEFFGLLTGQSGVRDASVGGGLVSSLLGGIGGLFGGGGGGAISGGFNPVSGALSGAGAFGVPTIFGAKGLVLDQPAFVGYRGSSPVVGGEAGREGLFPLARNSRGDLGVVGEKTVIQIQLSPEVLAEVLEQANSNTVEIINSPTFDARVARSTRKNEKSRIR